MPLSGIFLSSTPCRAEEKATELAFTGNNGRLYLVDKKDRGKEEPKEYNNLDGPRDELFIAR